MITMRDFNEVVGHRITEGSEYWWNCYGSHAYSLDYWNGDQDGYSASIIFDTKDQTVYEVTVCDYRNNRAYRRINPDFLAAYNSEAQERGVQANQACDDVNFVDLETDEDFLEKAHAIVAGEDYDTRVSIPLELPEDVMFELMQQAHEQDITFNQHMENIVRAACDEALADPEAFKKKVGLTDSEETFADFFASTQAPINRKAKKQKKAKRRDLGMELLGVITDYEETGEFDEVCLETVKRVHQELCKKYE